MNKSLRWSVATFIFGSGTNKIGSGMNKNLLIFDFLRFEDKGRIHIIHEGLRGSLPENSHTVGQRVKDGTTAPARQRHSQCVVSNLAFFTT